MITHSHSFFNYTFSLGIQKNRFKTPHIKDFTAHADWSLGQNEDYWDRLVLNQYFLDPLGCEREPYRTLEGGRPAEQAVSGACWGWHSHRLKE